MAEPRILVVKDDFLQRMLLADELGQEGFVVHEAETAEEAMAALKSGKEFEAVVTDIRLLGPISGFHLAHWVRRNFPGTFMILTSGRATRTDAAAELCGSYHFLAKPFYPEELTAKLRHLLDRNTPG